MWCVESAEPTVGHARCPSEHIPVPLGSPGRLWGAATAPAVFCGAGTRFGPAFGKEWQCHRNLRILLPLLAVRFYLADMLKGGH